MLHLIPPGMQRPLMPLANRVRLLWHKVLRPDVRGVALIAFDEHDQLLLVRHSYGARKWALPAGGLKRDEDPEVGMRREIREELAVDLLNVRLVIERHETLPGTEREHHVWVYVARIGETPTPDMREVVEAKFFPLDELPEPLEKRVRPRLELLRGR